MKIICLKTDFQRNDSNGSTLTKFWTFGKNIQPCQTRNFHVQCRMEIMLKTVALNYNICLFFVTEFALDCYGSLRTHYVSESLRAFAPRVYKISWIIPESSSAIFSFPLPKKHADPPATNKLNSNSFIFFISYQIFS